MHLVADVLENVLEYVDSLPDLMALRVLSRQWHDAVRATLKFVNGRDDTRVDDKHGGVAAYYADPSSRWWLGAEGHGWSCAASQVVVFQHTLVELRVRGRVPGEPSLHGDRSTDAGTVECPEHLVLPELRRVTLGFDVRTDCSGIGAVLQPHVSPKLEEVDVADATHVAGAASFLTARAPMIRRLDIPWPAMKFPRRVFHAHGDTMTTLVLRRCPTVSAVFGDIHACSNLQHLEIENFSPWDALPDNIDKLPASLSHLTIAPSTTLNERWSAFASRTPSAAGSEAGGEHPGLRCLRLHGRGDGAEHTQVLPCVAPFALTLEVLDVAHRFPQRATSLLALAEESVSDSEVVFPRLTALTVDSLALADPRASASARMWAHRYPRLRSLETSLVLHDSDLPVGLTQLAITGAPEHFDLLRRAADKGVSLTALHIDGKIAPLPLASWFPQLEECSGSAGSIQSVPLGLRWLRVTIDASDHWHVVQSMLTSRALANLRSFGLSTNMFTLDTGLLTRDEMLDTFIDTLPLVEELDVPVPVDLPRRAPPSRIVLRGQWAEQFSRTSSPETNAKRVRTMERYFDVDRSTWRR